MPNPLESRQQIVDLVREHITPRTKVCSLCHIDTITGVQLPLADVAAVTRPRGIVLVCDGAQAPGMIPVDVKSLGVDTYAFSGHKWMLTPKGNGLLYIRKEMQERIQPMFLHSGYRGYTASSGTRDVARILGFGAALDFQRAIGTHRVEERCHQLNAYMRAQLQEISDIRPLTPANHELACAIQTWTLDKGNAGEIRTRLYQDHEIIVKGAQGTYAYSEEEGLPRNNYNAIRFSTHVFNNEAEIDRAVDMLGGIIAEI
jgi:selenocysteine lyase/cysteine desulfurase